jgi:hypothetical protein
MADIRDTRKERGTVTVQKGEVFDFSYICSDNLRHYYKLVDIRGNSVIGYTDTPPYILLREDYFSCKVDPDYEEEIL